MIRTLIRRERHRRGWSLQELAQRTGLTVPAIQQFETGKRSLYVDSLLDLFDALDIRIVPPDGRELTTLPDPQPEWMKRFAQAEKDVKTALANSRRALTQLTELAKEWEATLGEKPSVDSNRSTSPTAKDNKKTVH